jgi:hypothetical protein
VGGGRGKYGKENPRRFYAVGLRTEPAPIVRGSSRRITIMRFRPANIRVISRRKNYLDHNPRCLPRARTKKKKQFLVVDRSFHIRTIFCIDHSCVRRGVAEIINPLVKRVEQNAVRVALHIDGLDDRKSF